MSICFENSQSEWKHVWKMCAVLWKYCVQFRNYAPLKVVPLFWTTRYIYRVTHKRCSGTIQKCSCLLRPCFTFTFLQDEISVFILVLELYSFLVLTVCRRVIMILLLMKSFLMYFLVLLLSQWHSRKAPLMLNHFSDGVWRCLFLERIILSFHFNTSCGRVQLLTVKLIRKHDFLKTLVVFG